MDSEKGIAASLGATFNGIGVDVYYGQGELEDTVRGFAGLTARARQIDGNPTEPDVNADGTTSGRSSGGWFAQRTAITPAGAISRRVGAFVPGSDIVLDDENLGASDLKSMGLKVTMPAGEGVAFHGSYSVNENEPKAAAEGWVNETAITSANADTVQVVANAITLSANYEVKHIEFGVSYKLGGGATLKASVEKKDSETTVTLADANPAADANSLQGVIAAPATGTDAQDAQADAEESYTWSTSNDTTTLKALIAFTF